MNTAMQARNKRGILVGITLQEERLFVNDWFTPHTVNQFTDRTYAVSELESIQAYKTDLSLRGWVITITKRPVSSYVYAGSTSEVYTDITEEDTSRITSWWSEQSSHLL